MVRVNGLGLSRNGLWSRLALVGAEAETELRLTVKETLRFAAALLPPATEAFRTQSMIEQLIQTLALGPYEDRLVADLGRTERTRLKVAAKILLDTDILLLEDVIRGMDIFDAAFIVDYLRDWAGKLNRIVIMAANPPSYQLLTMFHKAGVLASGQLVYFGGSNELGGYFSNLDYPCPALKSPVDYYVDLVTADSLTAEASLESAERIRRLAELWSVRAAAPRPPPPGAPAPLRPLPATLSRRNPLAVIPVLYWGRCLLLLNNGWETAREPVAAALTSLWLGCLYFSLTTAHPGGIRDRQGLLTAFLSLAIVPSLAINIDRVFRERRSMLLDVEGGLYPRLSYLAAKVLFDAPLGAGVSGLLVIPAYALAGLQAPGRDGGAALGLQILITGLHLQVWRYASWGLAFASPNRLTAGALLGLVLLASALGSGTGPHPDAMWPPVELISLASPFRWAFSLAWHTELLGETETPLGMLMGNLTGPWPHSLAFRCPSRTVLEQRQGLEIQTARRCNATRGDEIWAWSGLDPLEEDWIHPDQVRAFWPLAALVALGAAALLALLLATLTLFSRHKLRPPPSRRR